mmetsp:Transcript_159/g.523  ORF Transcript_159/g.523 Transcript_159/m.523 type:complete len:248 (-) Transcript_159:57-800(-)
MSGRLSGATVRHVRQVSRSISECCASSSCSYSHSTIFRATLSGLLPWNGSRNVAILYNRHPRAQTSVLCVYGLCCTISGQEYRIVPTMDFIIDAAAVPAPAFCRASPKSATLTARVCDCTSTLLGVRSRCAMPFSTCRYRKARQSCTKIFHVCSSRSLGKPFSLAEAVNACSEMPLQNSMTIHRVLAPLALVVKEEKYWTTLGWSSCRSKWTSCEMSRATCSCARASPAEPALGPLGVQQRLGLRAC